MSSEENRVLDRTLLSREPHLFDVLLETKPLLLEFPFRKNMLIRLRDISALIRDPATQNSVIAFNVLGSGLGIGRSAIGLGGA